MPVTEEAATTAQDAADIEFVLQQLATLEPAAFGDIDAGCNGCHSCAHSS